MNVMATPTRDGLCDELLKLAKEARAEKERNQALWLGYSEALRRRYREKVRETFQKKWLNMYELGCLLLEAPASLEHLTGFYWLNPYDFNISFDDDLSAWVEIKRIKLNKDGTENKQWHEIQRINADFLVKHGSFVSPPKKRKSKVGA